MSIFNHRATARLMVEAEHAAVQAIQAAPMNPAGSHRVVVLGPKGGVGKTTASAALAHYLSELRGELVAAVDGNLHTGTLRRRLVPATTLMPAPMIELAALAAAGQAAPEWPWLARWHDLVGRMRVFSNQAADPALVEAMAGGDYRALISLLSRAAQIVVQDMGTSVAGDVARAALDCADTMVIATDLTQDTLELTMETVTALAGQPQSYSPVPTEYSSVDDGRYAPLVAGAIVVVNPSRDEDRDPADLDDLLAWLRAACAAVVIVPRDRHLAAGDLIDWAQVSAPARIAYLHVATELADRLPCQPLSSIR